MWFLSTRWISIARLLTAYRTFNSLQFPPFIRFLISSVIASLALLTVQCLAIPPSTAYEGISRTPSVIATETPIASKLPRLTVAVLEQLAASSIVAFTPCASASTLFVFAPRANRVHSTSILVLLTRLIPLGVLLSISRRSPFIRFVLVPL